jgi:hypothetical protein
VVDIRQLKQAITEEFSFPSGPHLNEGDIFLSAGSTLKGFGKAAGIPAGTWASGGSLNNGRTGVSGSRNSTSHTSASAFGGFTTPPLTARGYTEEYNGTSWSEDTDLNIARGQTSGAGTSAIAGICYGGETYPSPTNKTETEVWNGSSWTEVGDLNVALRAAGNTGTTTAALAIGGTPTGNRGAKTEVWDGSSWTESGDVPAGGPSGLAYNAAFGTTTAAITAGGGPAPSGNQGKAFSWTGSSWSEVAELNTAKTGGMAFGSNADSGLVFGSPNTTELWNGTSWTEVNDQSTGKKEGGTGGSSVSGLSYGGNDANTATTEEFTVTTAALSTITVS